MTAVAWANLYICANALLALAAALLKVLGILGGKLERPIAYKHRLAVGHALLVAAVLLPFATLLSEGEAVLPRTAQVWSAPTMNGGATDWAQDQRIAFAVAPPGVSVSLAAARDAAAAAVSIGLLISLLRLGRDIRGTRRIIAHAHTVRRRGRLSVRVSEHIDVPFSFWWPGRYVIAVPSSLVLHPGDLKMAILHEGQHHRQQDTKWLYLYQLLKALFFWNPAVHGLGDLHRLFGDWGLAIRAYNAGAARVEEGMRATGSRDVWRIIAAGYENDPDYVPSVMAAVLILGSPPPAD